MHDITTLHPTDEELDVGEVERLFAGVGLRCVDGRWYPRDSSPGIHVSSVTFGPTWLSFDLTYGSDGAFREMAEAVLSRYRCEAIGHRETTYNHDDLRDDEIQRWPAPVTVDDIFPASEMPMESCSIVELTCARPLWCRAVMASWRVSTRQAEAHLAAAGARPVVHGTRVAVEVIEPLEMITFAQLLVPDARRRSGFALRAFAASQAAHDLLRDTADPMRSAWQWVCDCLVIDPLDGAFVATSDHGFLAHDASEHGVLAVCDRTPRRNGRTEVLIGDGVVGDFLFERDRVTGDWYVVGASVDGHPAAELVRIETGARITSGERVVEVIAIL